MDGGPIPGLELIQVADVAREKSIERALWLPWKRRSRKPVVRNGLDRDIRAMIDRKPASSRWSAGSRWSRKSRMTPRRWCRRRVQQELPPVFGEFGASRCRRSNLPDRRPDGKAGDLAKGTGRRTRPSVRGIQGPCRRDRCRYGKARGKLFDHGRPGRAEAVIRREMILRKPAPGRPGARYIIDVRKSSAARRFSCRAPATSSASSSPRKCPKSMTASSRSRVLPVRPEAAPRSPSW